LVVYVEDQAAEAFAVDWDFAVVGAHAAGDSVGLFWWFWWQTKFFSGLCVNSICYFECFLWFFSDAL